MLPPLIAVMSAPAVTTSIPGSVIVARSEGNALIIWDVSALLRNVNHDPSTTDEILKTIEANAARILVERAPAIPHAQTISVKAIYPHDPELNPAYGVTVVSHVERLLTLTAKKEDIPKKENTWTADLRQGKTPANLTLNITGKLPW